MICLQVGQEVTVWIYRNGVLGWKLSNRKALAKLFKEIMAPSVAVMKSKLDKYIPQEVCTLKGWI